MNKIKIIAFTVSVCLLGEIKAQSLTIEQTVNYIQSKVKEFGQFDQVLKGSHELSTLTFWADASDICLVHIREQVSTRPMDKINYENKAKWQYDVDLHHLDKERIDVYGTDGFVNAVTLTWRCKNSAQNIKRTGPLGEVGYDFKRTFNFRANVKDVERIKKAFVHGIKLCEEMDVDPFD